MEGGGWQPALTAYSAHMHHMPVLQMGPLQAAEMAGACGGRALAAQLVGMTVTSGTATAADLIAAVRGEDNGLTDSLQRWALRCIQREERLQWDLQTLVSGHRIQPLICTEALLQKSASAGLHSSGG